MSPNNWKRIQGETKIAKQGFSPTDGPPIGSDGDQRKYFASYPNDDCNDPDDPAWRPRPSNNSPKKIITVRKDW